MKKVVVMACMASFAVVLAGCGQQGSQKNDSVVVSGVVSTDVGSTGGDEKYDANSWKTIIPVSCKSFNDGCNNCMKSGTGENDMAACTKMYCEVYEKPTCLDDKGDANMPTVNDYLGLTVEEAAAKAQSANTPFRVVSIDGKPQAVTADYRPGRLNASIVDGKVMSIDIE